MKEIHGHTAGLARHELALAAKRHNMKVHARRMEMIDCLLKWL